MNITTIVKPDTDLPPIDVLKATGAKMFVDPDVVKNMPKRDGQPEIIVNFFQLNYWPSDDELHTEYIKRDMISADPFSLAKINQLDKTFSIIYHNCTHWKNQNGEWCCLSFSFWNDERHLDVWIHKIKWSKRFWFAGIPISS